MPEEMILKVPLNPKHSMIHKGCGSDLQKVSKETRDRTSNWPETTDQKQPAVSYSTCSKLGYEKDHWISSRFKCFFNMVYKKNLILIHRCQTCKKTLAKSIDIYWSMYQPGTRYYSKKGFPFYWKLFEFSCLFLRNQVTQIHRGIFHAWRSCNFWHPFIW